MTARPPNTHRPTPDRVRTEGLGFRVFLGVISAREFREETGFAPPDGPTLELGAFRQANRKVVTVFAREGDLDASAIRSNLFEIEYPPRSGRMASFPEIDRAEWVAPDVARAKLVRGQVPAIDALLAALAGG